MSWRYLWFYFLDSITAPTLWVGLGMGIVIGAATMYYAATAMIDRALGPWTHTGDTQ